MGRKGVHKQQKGLWNFLRGTRSKLSKPIFEVEMGYPF